MNLEEAIYELEDLMFDVEDRESVKAIKIILQELEHLQKENEEYSKQLDLDYVNKNFVSKEKIRELIEKETVDIAGFECIALEDIEYLLKEE